MDIVSFFTSPATVDILFKVCLSILLSSVIGIERELIHKPAGIKTHTLICISSTLVMALGMYMYENLGSTNIDPSRLPSQILAGIGFVGAGTIIRDGFSVKGITTAASLLAITCIGLTVGAGFYEGAVIATIFVFLVLSLTNPLQQFIIKNRKYVLFSITTKTKPGIIGEIEDVFANSNIEITSIRKTNDEVSQYSLLKVLVACKDSKVKENLISTLCKMDDVKEVYTSKRTYQHDSEGE